VHCTHFSGSPPERYLCLPVVAHGETLGVVTVECLSPEAAKMAEAREESVVSLAEMAAMSISGLRLRTRLERQSIRDGMTGLFNRSFMEVALERELHRAARQSKDLALMMVDIDHFKQFNDTFGHEAGDLVLREVAENLRLGVRSEDIVCRFGGEEFVIILPEISPTSALERAELLRQRIEGLALRYHGQPLRQVTVSIGLALSPVNSQGSDDLLRCADRAMYAAKRRGRNRVVQAEAGVEA
jgi:diguanylate cyclase (GGDEF)-like protein